MIRPALALSLLTLVLCATASASAPTATAAKTCNLTAYQQRHSGATYLLDLKVTGTSCATGLKVEKAWQSCRRASAGHTTCKKPVLHYQCKQKVLDSIKSQYDARVTCRSAGKSVLFTYTQNK